MTVRVEHGDCREVIRTLADCSVDSCVTDPPYALVSIVKRFGGKRSAACQEGSDGRYKRLSGGFMGQKWDTGEVAFDPAFWAEVLRVLKPGAHLFAFSGTRTYHRMACAIEDAGFEIRDQIGWLYGSGFPKSHDVSKGIDRHNGETRPVVGRAKGAASADTNSLGKFNPSYDATSAASAAWDGWGTALKPAWEPIVLARKPLIGTVAENVLKHGTGALNIDGCRVGTADTWAPSTHAASDSIGTFKTNVRVVEQHTAGRWPANVIHDGSEEVVGAFPETSAARVGNRGLDTGIQGGKFAAGERAKEWTDKISGHDDAGGSAARFFYTAKADADDRLGSKHPTVKPVDLIRWLVRLITPPGGVVLDPFAGSGTTGMAAIAEGFDAILIEREAEYLKDIKARLAWARGEGPLTESLKRRNQNEGEKRGDDSPLFAGLAS